MNNFSKLMTFALSFVALAACAQTAPPAAKVSDDTLRATNVAWNKAYNAGDGEALAALYAEDAVLSAPGAPPVRGRTAIREYYLKDAPAFAASGLTAADDPAIDVGQSGDLAWESGTYKVTDKSGAAVDTGKFLSVLRRKDAKWMIIRDTWNSDTPTPPRSQ
jgi:uncharacterized protein (TIGR02246 family)